VRVHAVYKIYDMIPRHHVMIGTHPKTMEDNYSITVDRCEVPKSIRIGRCSSQLLLSAPRNVVVVGLAHERGVTTGWNELIERHNHRISVTISFPQSFLSLNHDIFSQHQHQSLDWK
jgi:hypothetical protein